MRNRIVLSFAVLLCCMFSAAAQDDCFLLTGWQELLSDTVMPYTGFQKQLDGRWQDSIYHGDIEYPELVEIPHSKVSQWNLDSRNIPEWPVTDIFIGSSKGSASLDFGFIPIIRRDGRYMGIVSYKPVLSASVQSPSARKAGSALSASTGMYEERYAAHSVLSQGKWVKIRVPASGVYRIPFSRLKAAGFSDPSRVRLFGYGGELLPETRLQSLVDDLPEQPLWRGDDYLLFTAKGPDSWSLNSKGEYSHVRNTYSSWGYYFLTDMDGVPAQFLEMVSDSTFGPIVDTYPEHIAYDPDEFSWYHSGRRFFEDYDYKDGGGKSYDFSMDGLKAGSNVRLSVAFAAAATSKTSLQVLVNDINVGNLSMDALQTKSQAMVSEKSISCSNAFKPGRNSIHLVHDRSADVSGRLDFLNIEYLSDLKVGSAPFVEFRTSQALNGISFKVSGAGPSYQVWRVAADGAHTVVPAYVNEGAATTYAASYRTDDRLYAVDVNSASFPEPEFMGPVENQDLHAIRDMDMVIVIPASGKLQGQAERLAQAHREYDSLSVAVVRADCIYNEFSSGTPDATAIRRFMKMLYDRGMDEGKSPSYLLLFGDGAWDNRMKVNDWRGTDPDDYLLCYESDMSTNAISSYVMEDYFGLLDDNEGLFLLREKVDVGVGRFPVTTEQQAKVVVDKTISYMTGKNAGAWQNIMLFLGDDGDDNQHMRDADAVAVLCSQLYPALDQRKIYWDSYKMEVTASYNGYPSVRKQLLQQLDEGALVVNYSGHGNTDVLSHELVVDKDDFASLTSERLPFWITGSCDIAPFDATLDNIGENLLLNSKGGAVGLLTTTRTVVAGQNRMINLAFSRNMLTTGADGRRNSVGDALRLAKNSLVTSGAEEQDYSVNKLHFVLLADPALKLAVPELTAVIDSFAGMPAQSEGLSAKAGSVVRVTGHIENMGAMAGDFNGMVQMVIYDNMTHRITLNNLQTAEHPFEYDTRESVLYSGSDSVRNGLFCLEFPVPLDISYSDESGRISLFARDVKTNVTAGGYWENFTVGGSAAALSDSIGPEVSMYLNTPDFIYGDKVNVNPLFVADIHDVSGVNSSGLGLGHDILLMIDNNPDLTWSLNGFFTQDTGDYTTGRVVFCMPELPEGKHTLMFRVWDVMNNSTTRYLEFNVVKGLRPSMALQISGNPAREKTTFVIQHDRAGASPEIVVQVFNTSGQLLWSTSRIDMSAGNQLLLDWNLTDETGRRLPAGLYIVKASVSTGDGEYGSVQEKLVVTGR